MELEQLRVSFEDLGLTPEEISADRDMDIAAVKAGLMQCSSKYRKLCKSESIEEDRLNFSDEDLMLVNRRILELALYSPDEHIATKNLHYVRDDKKGRKEVVKQMGNQTFNIIQFNESMKLMRQQAAQAKQIVDV